MNSESPSSISRFLEYVQSHKITRREAIVRGTAVGLNASLVGTIMSPSVAWAQMGDSGELVLAVVSDPACWNPIEGPCGGDSEFYSLVTERLLAFDENLAVAPALATDWTAIDDLTWEFKLREGVRFTNGEEFNADAAAYMFRPIVEPDDWNAPPTAVGSYRLLDSVEVVDDFTIRFHTSDPFPLLERYLTFEPRAVPPQYYGEVGWEEYGQSPIGTGPYKLVEWVRNDHFTLEANEEYWDGVPAIKRLVFRPVPEAATRVAELVSDGVGVAHQVPAELVETIESTGTAQVISSPSIRVVYINLRADEKITDLALREAFQYATDTESIINDVLGGMAESVPSGNPVTQFEFGYDPEVPDWPYDLELAKEKLAEAGYDGWEIEFYYSTEGVPQVSTVVQALQAQWAEAGLNVSLHGVEGGIWNQYWRERTIPGHIFLTSTGGKAMDSDARLVPHAHSYDPENGLGRVSYFGDPEIDEIIKASQVEMDPEKREELLKQAWRLHRDSAHIISLYSPNLIYGVNNSVSWTPTVEDMFSTLADATMEGGD